MALGVGSDVQSTVWFGWVTLGVGLVVQSTGWLMHSIGFGWLMHSIDFGWLTHCVGHGKKCIHDHGNVCVMWCVQFVCHGIQEMWCHTYAFHFAVHDQRTLYGPSDERPAISSVILRIHSGYSDLMYARVGGVGNFLCFQII